MDFMDYGLDLWIKHHHINITINYGLLGLLRMISLF